MTRAAILCVVLFLPVVGQQAADLLTKAPPDVDAALRERVTEFFALESQGKFRQAEAMVCQDSKDAYYNAEKRRWLSSSIQKVLYDDGFAKARITLALTTDIKSRAGTAPMTVPLTFIWKVEENKWCQYIPPPGTEAVATPFGVFRPGQAGDEKAPLMPRPVNIATVASGVKASQTQLRIDPKQGGTATVEITNTLSGSVQVSVEGHRIEGLSSTVKQGVLGANEKTVMEITYVPGDKIPPAEAMLVLKVEPTGQRILVKVQLQ